MIKRGHQLIFTFFYIFHKKSFTQPKYIPSTFTYFGCFDVSYISSLFSESANSKAFYQYSLKPDASHINITPVVIISLPFILLSFSVQKGSNDQTTYLLPFKSRYNLKMNKAITILLVLLVAQQTIALRINSHLDDAPLSNVTALANDEEVKKVLGELKDDVENVLNNTREEGEENDTLEQLAKHRVEEGLEFAKEKLGKDLNRTDENGTRLVDSLESAAKNDVDKALEQGEEQLPEVLKKFVEGLNKAFDDGYLESETDEDGNSRFKATDKLDETAQAGFEKGAQELEKQLNEAFEALNRFLDL